MLCRHSRVRVTGNPIRHIAGLHTDHATRMVPGKSSSAEIKGRPQLLILGGSGGARSINESLPRAIYKAAPR